MRRRFPDVFDEQQFFRRIYLIGRPQSRCDEGQAAAAQCAFRDAGNERVRGASRHESGGGGVLQEAQLPVQHVRREMA